MPVSRTDTSTTRCPGIVPPYLLERLADAQDDTRAAGARQSLALDATHRRRRLLVGHSDLADRPAAAATGSGPGPHRTVSDAASSTTLPGRLVRSEGSAPTGDPAVDEAYDGLGATWTLYEQAYGRDSLDGRGMPLDASVHYGQRYDNAFWDGTQMVFGDGDGVTFNRFTVAVDVIGHELTHGVTQLTAALTYQGQSGALNESISDVFGSLVKQRLSRQDAATADWLIGQGLFTAQVHGVALRSLRAPGSAYDDPVLGRDPQPATMAGYVQTQDDNGGVHVNSGIPNHAFYLAATAIGGYAWQGAGQVWYDVLTGGAVHPDVDFAGFAEATVEAAAARYGDTSTTVDAVRSAWQQVGVLAGSGPARPVPAPPSASDVVHVSRSGGFAGIPAGRQVRLGSLPAQDAQAWRSLLGSQLLRDLAAEPPQPDRYVYRVACPPQGLDVTAAEQQLPDDVRELLERTLRGD